MAASELTTLEEIASGELLSRVDMLRSGGWRIVQILCVGKSDANEIYYSFGLDLAMKTLKLSVKPGESVQSITPYFGAAFLYENEVRDLFGVDIRGISLDWQGKLLEEETEKPFSKVSLRLASSERPDSGLLGKIPGKAE